MVVIGSANVDVLCNVPRLPAEGETLTAERMTLAPGGKGLNQAVSARRSGAVVDLIASLGDDALGRDIRTWMRNAGVGDGGVIHNPAPTGTAVVLVEPDASNRIVVGAGANAQLGAEHVASALSALTEVDCVVSCCEVGDDAITSGFRLAKREGATTVLNPSPFRPSAVALFELSDWAVLNEVEFRSAFDEEPTAEHMVAAAAAWDLGLVVTAGEAGATLVRDDLVEFCPAPVVQAVDTTGAGDAFLGAFACALAAGEEPSAALRAGVAAGSRCVETEGAQLGPAQGFHAPPQQAVPLTSYAQRPAHLHPSRSSHA
ncbi:ribokinase [Microbacterium soli]|uniref:Ribokinase n=1 Tax=Microbacterium soli TaxID=446075 RepID=A0ABP7MZL2_9MICO